MVFIFKPRPDPGGGDRAKMEEEECVKASAHHVHCVRSSSVGGLVPVARASERS